MPELLLEDFDFEKEFWPERYDVGSEVVIQQVPKYQFPVGVTRSGDVYTIDYTESKLCIYTGGKGKGKTMGIRRNADYHVKMGDLNVYPNDIAGEYIYSKNPNNKFDLPDFDSPEGIPGLVNCVPDFSSVRKSGSILFSFKSTSLSFEELRSILDVKGYAGVQKMVLRKFYNFLQSNRSRPNFRLTWEVLFNFLRHPEVLYPEMFETPDEALDARELNVVRNTIREIVYKLESLISINALDSRNATDIEKLLGNRDRPNHIILDLSGIKLQDVRVEKSVVDTHVQVFIDTFHEQRKLWTQTHDEKYKIPRINFVFDEFQRVVGKRSESYAHDAAVETFIHGRKYGISAEIGVLFIYEIDEIFLKNADYLFIATPDSESEVNLLKNTFKDIFPNNPRGEETLRILNTLGQYEFFAIKKGQERRSWGVVKLYPSLSMHKTEEK